jgi:hypothetical protein
MGGGDAVAGALLNIDRQRQHAGEHRRIGHLALLQPLPDGLKDMRGLGDEIAGLRLGDLGEELQEQRQVIGQLAARHRKAVALVQRHQVHHRLATVAALAMHVLEQVKRERARAVEQQDVALLQVVEVARGDLLQQAVEAVTVLLRQPVFGFQRGSQLGNRGLQFGRGIGEQDREDLEGELHEPMNSVGVRTVLARGLPNRPASVRPSEQPLPNEKPHEPLRS